MVLFVGGDKGTRQKEAHQLIREGFADYLIIPANYQVLKLSHDGQLITIDIDLSLGTPQTPSNQPTNELTNQQTSFSSSDTSHFKLKTAFWLEDTHIEALLAHDMLEHLGQKSAILVSSPYHMRRIKLIAGKVFGDEQTLHYVHTRYEPMDLRQIRWISSEYVKIIWFMIYQQFI